MAKKFVPDPELLNTILTTYKTEGSYAAVSRVTGISPAIIKRIITENCGPTNGKNYLSYEGLPPEEPKMPISKAQFYYKLQLLMKEILNV